MTPIGHASVSYLSSKGIRSLYMPAMVIGGCLPDIDFLFLKLDSFNEFHRVVTHNLFFVFLMALAIPYLFCKENRLRFALSLFIGGLLHILIDSCMDSNPTNGIGVAILWPIDDRCYSLFNIMTPDYSISGWGQPGQMLSQSLKTLVIELPFWVTAGFIFLKSKHRMTLNRKSNILIFFPKTP